jgi:hypothetical protein
MSIQQDNLLQDLTKYTVAIENPDTGRVLGTGVIVTEDGLIVTCYHVLESIISNTKTVRIHFPTAISAKMQADIVQESHNQSLDIAFLRLQQTNRPDKIIAANLNEMVTPTHAFIGFGFKKAQEFDGLHVKGEIQGKAHKILSKDSDTTTSPPLIQLQSHQIAPGMSGSAILDTKSKRVIGIVSEKYRTQDDAYKDLSFGIPVESIIKVYPSLREKNPGLKPIFDFVRKIGQEGTRKYEKIDELYVQPNNYDEIKRSLEEDKILFLTGTREYGKTYTAVHLLWEYYKNKGYEPIWFKGADEKEERRDVRKKFANVEEYLKPHNIIYFEDPFGKTEYEVNVDEGIIRNIATIIETVENTEDTYAIITSREEVFKEFEHKIIAEVDLKKYEKKLSVKTPYSYEKRKEMVLKYAEIMGCKWHENEELRKTVLEAIKDDRKLPTPLNIEQFAIATAKKSLEKDNLIEKLEAKSIETAKSFAEEIKSMSIDKILFLSFPFISEYFSIEHANVNYQKLVMDLTIEDAWDFYRVIKWFKDDKIDIIHDELRGDIIRFSHPSYFEAFRYAISENGSLTKAGKILSNILLKLAVDKGMAGIVVRTIANNFDEMPENVRNLLFRLAYDLAYDEETHNAWYVAYAIAANFDKLPDNVRNLLFKLLHDDKASEYVAYAVSNYFNRFPDDVRNKLLVKLVNNEARAWNVSWEVPRTMANNYDELPDNVRNLLFKLAENKDAAGSVAHAVAENFDKLPPNVQYLLFKLAENKDAAGSVADAVADNYDELPDNVRNLLFKLAENKDAAGSVADAIIYNSYRLPDNVRNLLFKLAENKDAAGSVAHAVAENFDKLPPNVQNLLFKLAENKVAAGSVAHAVADNYDELPPNVQNLLFKLAENKDAAGSVAHAVADNYDELPDDVGNLLFKLAENEEIDWRIVSAISYNYDKLPDDIRNKLLVKVVSDKEVGNNKEATEELAEAMDNDMIMEHILSNFNNLPDNVRNLLFKLAENSEKVSWRAAMTIVYNYGNFSDNVRNLLFKLAENEEMAWSISYAIANNYDELPDDVRNLLFKLAENKDVSRKIVYAVASNFNNIPENVRNKLLMKLADDKESVLDLAYAIAYKFDELPDNIRNKIVHNIIIVNNITGWTINRHDDVVKTIGVLLISNYDKISENVKDLLFQLADNNTVAKQLSVEIRHRLNELPKEITFEFLIKLAENKDIAGNLAWTMVKYFDKLPENVRNELLLKLVRLHKNEVDEAVAVVVSSKLPDYVRNELLLL